MPCSVTSCENSVKSNDGGHSVQPVASTSAVHLLEGKCSTPFQETFGFEAFVLVVAVCAHAVLEGLEFIVAKFAEDVLAGRGLIFSGEENDAFVGEGALSLGSTEVVDHVFHWHFREESCLIL